MATTYDIARCFSRRLRAQLSACEMEGVIVSNGLESDPNICHSHDYCDANQVLIDALEELGVPYGHIVGMIDSETRDAWDVAKECDFDEAKINDLERYWSAIVIDGGNEINPTN